MLREMSGRIEHMKRFTGWLDDDKALNVRFEDLFTPQTLKTVADFLERKPKGNHLEKAYGGTITFTGQHSDWRQHWNDLIDKHWSEIGGCDLEKRWGYELHNYCGC